MSTLYELTGTLRHLLDLAQSGEVDQQTIDETIESMNLVQDTERKIEGYAIVLEELKASNERIRKEEKRLAERRRTQQNTYDRIRRTLLDQMKLLEIDKVKTDRYTVSIRQNPVKIVVEDDRYIPKAYFDEQPPKLNRKKLKEYIMTSGETVKGVELTQDESLQIK